MIPWYHVNLITVADAAELFSSCLRLICDLCQIEEKKKLTYLNDQSSSIVLNCAFVRCVHAPSSCSVSVLTVVCLGVGLDAELSFLVTDGLCLFLLLWCSLCRPSCPFLRWLSVSIAPPPPPMPQLTPQIPLTGFVARMQESSKWRG